MNMVLHKMQDIIMYIKFFKNLQRWKLIFESENIYSPQYIHDYCILWCIKMLAINCRKCDRIKKKVLTETMLCHFTLVINILQNFANCVTF